MSQPSFNRSFGRAAYPTDDDAESTLANLDPARDILLELLTAAINAELGSRWASAAIGTPLEETEPVQSSHPQEPDSEYMREVKVNFPALFVHRDGDAEGGDFSIARRKWTQRWLIHWILGPLGAASRRKLTDAFPYVAKLISEIFEQGGHPAYQADPSGQRALRVLTEPAYCDFASAKFIKAHAGQAGFSDEGQSPTYWALFAEIETVELSGFADSSYGTRPLNVEWSMGTGNEEGVIEDLFRAESAPEPDP